MTKQFSQPPQSMEAERALLGAILIKPGVIREVLVEDKHFYSKKHTIIWHALKVLNDRSIPIDLISVTNYLLESGELESVGGSTYVGELLAAVPATSNVRHYAEIIHKKALLRRLIEAGENIKDVSGKEDWEIERIIDYTSKLVSGVLDVAPAQKESDEEIESYAGVDRIVTSREMALELDKTDESVFNVKTGFPMIDRLLNGVEAGELIVVTGPTGEGKTTWLMSVTTNMARSGVDSVWFTLEVTPRQFIKKITKANGGDKDKLPAFYLPHAGFDDIDPSMVRKFKQSRKRDLQMIDWIEMKIIEAKLKAAKAGGAVKAIFIDHMHQIFSLERIERNVSLELGDMVAKIKQIAVDQNLIIFLIAHSKDDPNGTNREPRKEDIRDSGLISRLADTIVGVWRIPNDDDGSSTRRKALEDGDNKSKIRIFKNRREGTMGYVTAYHNDHMLVEIDKNREDFRGFERDGNQGQN
jgi:replicative DNA helicase